MALTSRLAIEVDGRTAEQQVIAIRKALEALTEAGLRVGPSIQAMAAALAAAGRNAQDAGSSVQNAKRQMDGLNDSGQRTSTIMAGASGSMSGLNSSAAAAEARLLAARRALDGLNESGSRTGPALNGAGGALNNAGNGARAATTQVQSLERQVKSLAAQAAGLAGPLAAVFSTTAFYQASEAYSTLTNRMKLVTDGAVELAEAQKAVFSIAQSSYQPLNATAELFQRIATNQRELGLTGKEVAGVVGTISKTLAISGASAASANAALVQLGQAFASGVLRGEELNSVMEQAPALAQAIAKGMGKTVGELRSLGAEGKLTADAVVKALQSQQGAVDELFNKTAVTIGNSITAFNNSFTQFVGKLDQASGASVAISEKIVQLSTGVDSLTITSQAASDTLEVFGTLLGGAAAAGAVYLTGKLGILTFETMKSVYAQQAARTAAIATAEADLVSAKAKQIQAQSAVISAELNARAALNQVAASEALVVARMAERAANDVVAQSEARLAASRAGALALIGGPLGALTIAAGLGAAAYLYFGDSADKATKSLIDQNLTIDESIIKFRELGEAQRSLKLSTWTEKQVSATEQAGKAFERFALRGRDAFQQLGAAGVEGGQAFNRMVEEARQGSRSLTSITEWVKQNKEIMPGYVSELQKAAAAHELGGVEADKWGRLINLAGKEANTAAGQTASMAAAQGESSKQTKAQTAEIDKYLAKLREQVTLYGASKQKIAEYEASKLNMNAQQREEAKILGQIQDVQEKYREALKKNDTARKESLRLELEALITQRNAAQDAAQKSVDAISRIHWASDKALGESVNRRITELSRLATFASSLPGNVNYLTGEGIKRPTIQGASMVPIGAPTPQNTPATAAARKTAKAEAAELVAQINETSEARTKAAKAYTESAGQKMLNQAREQAAVLREQSLIYDKQVGQIEKIGPEQQKLIKWEQELADIKSKKTLTADQKSLLANQEQITAALKANAAEEKKAELKKRNYELDQKSAELLKNLNAELVLSQQELNNDLAGIGLGQEGRRRLQEDLKIRQDYQKKVNDLQDQLNKGEIDKATYDKQTGYLKDALGQRLKMQEDYYRKLEIQQADWTNGANSAWQDYVDSAADISSQTYDLFSNAFGGMEDALVDFVTSGKLSFKSLADSIIADIARILIRTKIVTPALNALFGGSGAGGGVSSLLGGGGSSGGGFDLQGAWNNVSGAYSVATSGFGSAVSAGWSAGEGFLGGLQSAISGGYNYLSNAVSGLFSGGAAATGVSNVGFGLGQSLVSGGVGSSGAATGSSASYASGSGGATALGGALAGIGGALYGYGQAGLKGAATGAAGGVGGYYAGSAIGSLVGPLGTAIGGVIGSTLGSFLGGSLFGGSWQTKDVGLSLAVEDGDFAGRQYEYQKKKGGLFGKNKKRTRYSALDPEMQAALDATYDATEGSVLDLFDRLNVELNDGVLDGLNIGAQKISTKDKTAEEIQAEIAKWFGGVADSMVSAVDAATAAGLGGYNFEGLTAFVQNLEGVNDVIRYLNKDMFETSVAGGKLAEQLTAIAGGFDVLKANGATYYGAFIGESERMDDTLDAVTRAFVAANQTLPETRTGFRDMVESIDTTTQAGMGMFATLMALSGQAATYYDILEQRANDSVNAAFAAVQRAVAAQQKAISKSLADANSRISDLTGISNALGSALKQLRGTGDDAVRMLRSQAQATLQSALAIAKAGGSLSGFAGLTDALEVLGSNNTDLYGSLEEFNRDQGRTANAVAELNKLNGKQLSAAEKSALAMQAQLDALDAQLEFAQAQVDALNGIDNSVKSVAEAVKAMNSTVVAALQVQPKGAAQANTPQNNQKIVDTIYSDVLGRGTVGDEAGAAFWANALQSGTATYQDVAESIAKAALGNSAESAESKQKALDYLNKMGIPGFASGGNFAGGIRLVGERGPEIELTGPSRIISNRDAAQALRGGSDDGWQKVVQAIEVLQRYAYQTTKNTGNTAIELRQQNEAGVLIQGAAA